jgi:hypothetical protein
MLFLPAAAAGAAASCPAMCLAAAAAAASTANVYDVQRSPQGGDLYGGSGRPSSECPHKACKLMHLQKHVVSMVACLSSVCVQASMFVASYSCASICRVCVS